MFRDTRPDYPPEFDDHEWEGDTLADIGKQLGIEPAADALRAIDKYSASTVSLRLTDGTCLYVPDDLPRIRQLDENEPIAAWIIHGIAWDDTDWEYSEEVTTVAELEAARRRFQDALEEHLSLEDEEGLT